MSYLQESITTFDTWISPIRLKRAKDKWEQTYQSGQVGQKQILKAAAGGDVQAADFLFDHLKKVISKAFWKYFLGPNTKSHKHRVSGGADKDFASIAYEMLLGGAEGSTSPYKSFDPKKFSPSADLVKQFGYYLYRYLQNEAFKIIKAERRVGMTGNIGADDDLTVTSFDAATTSTEGKDGAGDDAALQTEDTFTEETNMKETLKSFIVKLRKENPEWAHLFVERMKDAHEGLNIAQTAKRLGINHVTIRNVLAQVEPMWKRFIGE